jgi:hypothetical protein
VEDITLDFGSRIRTVLGDKLTALLGARAAHVIVREHGKDASEGKNQIHAKSTVSRE